MRVTLLSSAAALALALAAPALAQTPSDPLPATSSNVNTGDNAAGTPNGLPPGQSPGMNQGLTPSANTQPSAAPGAGTTSPIAGQATANAPPDQYAPGAPPQSAPQAYRRYSASPQSQAETGTEGYGGEHWAHQPGTGESGPASNRASNIDSADTRSAIAPHLPQPVAGEDAGPARYLRDADNALASHRTGEAQQALEMAETRLLDRSTLPMNANVPDQSATVQEVSEARRALASGDLATARSDIQSALASRVPAGAAGVR